MKHEIIAILIGVIIGCGISYITVRIIKRLLKINEEEPPIHKCDIEENQTDLQKEVFSHIKHLLKNDPDSFNVEILTESFFGDFRNITNEKKGIALNTNGYIYLPLKISLSKDQKKEVKDLCDPIISKRIKKQIGIKDKEIDILSKANVRLGKGNHER